MSERPKSSYFIRKTTPASSSSTPSDNVPKPTSTLFNISGTRTSLQNNQLLTSIGIPSIDYYLGFNKFYILETSVELNYFKKKT